MDSKSSHETRVNGLSLKFLSIRIQLTQIICADLIRILTRLDFIYGIVSIYTQTRNFDDT